MAVLDTAIFFNSKMPASSAGTMRKWRTRIGRFVNRYGIIYENRTFQHSIQSLDCQP